MVVFDSDTLARSISSRRTARNMSQEGLADASGVSRGAISKIEQCSSKPSLESAVKIANALGCTVNDLLRIPK